MAEEQIDPKTENEEKNAAQAMKEKGDRLFGLLSKKELSELEKKEVQEQIKELPELLQSKSFMARFEVPDLFSSYQSGADMSKLLEKNAAARETLGVVLENLKEVNLSNGGSAAKYMLDNAWLPNGELIGTQFAKNMHFLVAAYMDDKTPALQDDDLKRAIDSDYSQMADTYKRLYDKDEGYNANPNGRNFLGQKVEDVMKASMATPHDNVEDLKNQTFVQTPDERQGMVINQARGTMTLEDLQMARYRGTLTAEQADLLNKMEEKSADLTNQDGDRKREEERKHDWKGFQDKDIIKYMYEDWFLAGMSWLFDKAEDGMYICLGALFDSKGRGQQEVVQGPKEFIGKVNAFNKNSMDAIEQIHTGYHGRNITDRHVDGQRESTDKLTQELSAFCQNPDPKKEESLKEQYGEAFIKRLKQDYQRDPEAVKHFMNKGMKNMLLVAETTEILAQRLAQLEMTSEAMKDVSSWYQPKTEKFKDDAELNAERNNKAKKIQDQLIDCCLIVAEEERSWASTRYNQLSTPEQRDQFVRDEILNTANPNSKEKMKMDYQNLKANGSPEQIKEWVCENIASQRVVNFLDSQRAGVSEASSFIHESLKQEKYDANDCKPSSDIHKCLKKLAEQRDQIQKDGAHDAELEGGERLKATIDHKADLLEAVKKNNLPLYFERAKTVNEQEEKLLQERRANNNNRKKKLKEWKNRVFNQNNYAKHQTQQGLPLTKPQNYGR